MARVTIEMGHVPRTRGATGTWREQSLTRAIGTRLAPALVALGHQVRLIGADDPMPPGDVFISLHGDSGNAKVARSGASTVRGGSVGYPGHASPLAAAWKKHHARLGYPGGFHRDNFTRNLSGYYRWSQTKGYRHRFLAEHGTLTHAGDEAWLFANVDRCVHAHAAAIGEVVGHPNTGKEWSDMATKAEIQAIVRAEGDRIIDFTRNMVRDHTNPHWIRTDRDLRAILAALSDQSDPKIDGESLSKVITEVLNRSRLTVEES